MKSNLLKIAASITAIAAAVSITIAVHPNPTETQKDLANTTNTIAIGGATAMFGLLDDDDEPNTEEED